ncbi:MAG: triose-phosphate isomerase [Bacilli bacterium]|nr:triose-phosphate isomerase [Bacilli bacterium]
MKLVVGNQKTYLNRSDVLDFINHTSDVDCSRAVVCPSDIYIDMYLDKSKYVVGAQNCSCKGNGASTGEISAEQLNSLGASYCIVAHSERRADQHETGDMFVKKINNLIENNIIPIFCVGENLDEKERNLSKDVVGKQILEVYDSLDPSIMEKIIIAYEPIWSIGTGKIPTNPEIEDVTSYIKDLIQDKYGKRVAVLYGGSVNMKNVDTLNEIDIVDGYLIGGASTKPEEFKYIMSKCER